MLSVVGFDANFLQLQPLAMPPHCPPRRVLTAFSGDGPCPVIASPIAYSSLFSSSQPHFRLEIPDRPIHE
jgi:hypothetical protein